MAASSDSSPSSCTRRRILGWGGAGLIGGLAAYLGWPRNPAARVAASRQAPAPPATMAPAEAVPSQPEHALGDGSRRDDFLPHLNSRFRIESAASAGADCTLVEISAAQMIAGQAGEFTMFSLLFTAPDGFAGESRIYQVSHPQMGRMELFLSPVGRSEEQVNLEAVFSERV